MIIHFPLFSVRDGLMQTIILYLYLLFQAIYLMTEDQLNDELMDVAPKKRTRDIFLKMDTNRDGVLSKEEFVKGCLNDETLYKLLACSGEEQQEL